MMIELPRLLNLAGLALGMVGVGSGATMRGLSRR
jgi:hypothetical protein